jgi:hypothetical protein
MNPRVYHRDIYLPPALVAAVQRHDFAMLRYGKHATAAALDDCVPPRELPRSLLLADWRLIHVETTADRPSGILVRRPMQCDPRLHVVLAIGVPDMLVRTVWVNRANDHHRTLDRARYVPRP